MKKFIIVLLITLYICNLAYAERKINCEIENTNAVTFFVEQLSQPMRLNFVKYAQSDNNNDYWLRVSMNSANRFMFFAKIKIEDKEFTIFENQNPTYSQKYATMGFNANTGTLTETTYKLQPEVIEAISQSAKPFQLIFNRQTKQNIVCKTDNSFLNAIKTIISYKYTDKNIFWNEDYTIKH